MTQASFRACHSSFGLAICAHIHARGCICVHECGYICMRSCVCMHECVYVYMYVCAYTCIYTLYIYTHTCMHIHLTRTVRTAICFITLRVCSSAAFALVFSLQRQRLSSYACNHRTYSIQYRPCRVLPSNVSVIDVHTHTNTHTHTHTPHTLSLRRCVCC